MRRWRALGDGTELEILRLTSTRFADGRRPENVSYRVGILPPRKLIQFPRNAVHDLDVLRNTRVSGGRGGQGWGLRL